MNLTDIYLKSIIMFGLHPTHQKMQKIHKLLNKLIVIKFTSESGKRYYYIYKSNHQYFNEVVEEQVIVNLFASCKRQGISHMLVDYENATHDAKFCCRSAILHHIASMEYEQEVKRGR